MHFAIWWTWTHAFCDCLANGRNFSRKKIATEIYCTKRNVEIIFIFLRIHFFARIIWVIASCIAIISNGLTLAPPISRKSRYTLPSPDATSKRKKKSKIASKFMLKITPIFYSYAWMWFVTLIAKFMLSNSHIYWNFQFSPPSDRHSEYTLKWHIVCRNRNDQPSFMGFVFVFRWNIVSWPWSWLVARGVCMSKRRSEKGICIPKSRVPNEAFICTTTMRFVRHRCRSYATQIHFSKRPHAMTVHSVLHNATGAWVAILHKP